MSWCQTYTGKAAFPLNLKPEQVCIEDIAHSLSLICRFNGHCKFHYSVAQHSVHVCDKLPKRQKLAGLLHDAAETYLGDVTRPLKRHIGFVDGDAAARSFSDVEYATLQVIFKVFEGPNLHCDWNRIIAVDNRMVMTEARDIMVKPPMPWHVPARPYADLTIHEWTPKTAEMLFLQRFKELTK